jgi:hypothetical protein
MAQKIIFAELAILDLHSRHPDNPAYRYRIPYRNRQRANIPAGTAPPATGLMLPAPATLPPSGSRAALTAHNAPFVYFAPRAPMPPPEVLTFRAQRVQHHPHRVQAYQHDEYLSEVQHQCVFGYADGVCGHELISRAGMYLNCYSKYDKSKYLLPGF